MPDPITPPEIELIPDLTFDEALKAVREVDPSLDDETARAAAQMFADGELLEPDEAEEQAKLAEAKARQWKDLSIQEKAAIADEEFGARQDSKARGIARKAVKGVAGAMKSVGNAFSGRGGKKPKKPKKPKTGFRKYGFAADDSSLLKLAAHGKPFTKVPEGLLVPDVEIMSYLKSSDRPEFKMPGDCDDKWFQIAEATCKLMAAKGKFPRLLRGHNQPGKPAEVIGQLRNVRWEAPWLRGDMLVTEPSAQGKLARGEFPSRSAEFYYGTAHLHGLSLTEGEPGHFEEELSDLALADAAGIDELRKLTRGDKMMRVLLDAPVKLTDAGDTINAKAVDELFSRIANLEAIITANGLTSTMPAKPAAKLSASDSSAEQQRLAAENAALALQLKNRQEADRLRAGGCPLSVEQIVTSLSALSTEEGRAVQLRHLASLKAAPAQTDVLPAEQTKEQRIRLQYRELKKELGEKMRQDEETFVRVRLEVA